MSKLVKVGGLVVVVVLLLPVAHYRSVTPCGMLRRELANRVERETEAAQREAAEHAREYGETAESVAVAVGEVVSDVTAGVAAGAAEYRVRRMSARECAAELWRLKVGGGE